MPEIIARVVLGVDKPTEKDVPSEDDERIRLKEDIERRRN